MIKAVNLGDDTDTVAAIAGGIAGLYYGYNNIPQDWLMVLKKRDIIEQMCNDYKGDLNMVEKAYKLKYDDKWVEIIKILGGYDYKLHDSMDDVKMMTLNQAIAAKGLISGDFNLDIDKIEVIKKLPPPISVKGIHNFLGHASFYRKIIKSDRNIFYR